MTFVICSHCPWHILQSTSSKKAHSIQVHPFFWLEPFGFEQHLKHDHLTNFMWYRKWFVLNWFGCDLYFWNVRPKKVLDSIKKCVLRIALVHLDVSFKVNDIDRYYPSAPARYKYFYLTSLHFIPWNAVRMSCFALNLPLLLYQYFLIISGLRYQVPWVIWVYLTVYWSFLDAFLVLLTFSLQRYGYKPSWLVTIMMHTSI